jgi:hypothetical protein
VVDLDRRSRLRLRRRGATAVPPKGPTFPSSPWVGRRQEAANPQTGSRRTSSSERAQPAIDHEIGTRDVAAFVRGEE